MNVGHALLIQLLAQLCLAAPNRARCASGGGSGGQALIPRELLVQTAMSMISKYPYNAQVSPDGTWLSYIAPGTSGGMPAIWVQKVSNILQGQNNPIDVSKKPDVFFAEYGWTQYPDMLYYGDGNALYTIDISNAQAAVTKEIMKTDKYWPPVVLKASPDRANMLLVGVGDTPPPPTAQIDLWPASIYEVDVSTALATKVFDNKGTVSPMAFDNQYNLRAALIHSSNESMDGYYGRNDGTTANPKWTRLAQIKESILLTQSLGNILPLKILSLDPSNSNMALWYDMMKDPLPVYVWRDLSQPSDKGTGTVVYRAQKAETTHWINDYGQLIGVLEQYGMPKMTIVDKRFTSDWHNVEAIDENASFNVVSQSLDMSKWVLLSQPSDKTPRYYLYDTNTKKSLLLFVMLPELDNYKLPIVQPVDVPSRDGFVQYCFLTKPYNAKEGEKRPLVTYFHGWPTSWTWGFNSDVLLMADRGYYVLACNYRGSTDYGRDYYGAGVSQYVNGSVGSDLEDAAMWAISTGLTDSDTVCTYGASMGGIEEFFPLVNNPGLYKCAVDLYGAADQRQTLIYAQQMQNLSDFMTKYYLRQYGFDWRSEEGRQFLDQNVAIRKAEQIQVPLYIAHGMLDDSVPFQASVELVDKLKQIGKADKVTFIAFPSEGHAGFQMSTEYVFHGYLELFLAKCLGGKYEPVGYIPGANYEVRYDTNGLTKMV